jgi:hypothetical protein
MMTARRPKAYIFATVEAANPHPIFPARKQRRRWPLQRRLFWQEANSPPTVFGRLFYPDAVIQPRLPLDPMAGNSALACINACKAQVRGSIARIDHLLAECCKVDIEANATNYKPMHLIFVK